MGKFQITNTKPIGFLDTVTGELIAVGGKYVVKGTGGDTLKLYKTPEWLNFKLRIIADELQISVDLATKMYNAPSAHNDGSGWVTNMQCLRNCEPALYERVNNIKINDQTRIIKVRIKSIEWEKL